MDLMPSPDQEQIIDSAHSFLAKELPVQYLRWEPNAAAAPDHGLLLTFAELGWLGMGLSEAQGGVGFGATEEMLLFREAGRFLVSPILLANVSAARIAAACGATAILEALIGGRSKCAIGIAAAGTGVYLIDATEADFIVLLAGDRVSLLPFSAMAELKTLRALDSTTTLHAARVKDVEAALVVAGPAAVGITCHISLLISAMLVGAAEAIRDLTVSHACERSQFGQKIGSFQAVSHRCADMALRCEAALSQTKMAAITLRDGKPDAEFQVRAARIVASDVAIANASAAVQLHGGIGFAAEYPVHFFLKRTHLLDQIDGSPAGQLDSFLMLTHPSVSATHQ